MPYLKDDGIVNCKFVYDGDSNNSVTARYGSSRNVFDKNGPTSIAGYHLPPIR